MGVGLGSFHEIYISYTFTKNANDTCTSMIVENYNFPLSRAIPATLEIRNLQLLVIIANKSNSENVDI